MRIGKDSLKNYLDRIDKMFKILIISYSVHAVIGERERLEK